MKKYILSILTILTLSCSFNRYKSLHCKINNVSHFSSYDGYNSEYSGREECIGKDTTIIQKYAKKNFKNCFCSKTVRGINKKYNEDFLFNIEPLYFNINNCTGLYSQRVWLRGGMSPRYLAGFPHQLFLINNEEFIDLYEADTLEIKEILYNENSDFAKIFPKESLDEIYELSKLETLWNGAVTNIPRLIMKDNEVVFDIFKSCQ